MKYSIVHQQPSHAAKNASPSLLPSLLHSLLPSLRRLDLSFRSGGRAEDPPVPVPVGASTTTRQVLMAQHKTKRKKTVIS
ncbi:hypothetical protein E2C01_003342 [Portunus trituberculatus]|uniref:Uncharacterized protein n=1 Tax=Portunus trituberculatus TaxID=210409 RepID=A0A5B7CLY4_PORTR|nr:hypothetical protein [Portunus trituberculatus]